MSTVEIDKGFPITCDKKSFYRLWLSFLAPIHHLTPQVIQIAAELLRHREELSSKILDESLLTTYLLGPKIREQIMEECGVTLSTFRVTINKLKKSGFLIDGKINPKFIPGIENPKRFAFALVFNIVDSDE